MSTPAEIELLKKALGFFWSSNPSSATDLRLFIDEQFKQRYGPEKTLTQMCSPKLLEAEKNFKYMRTTPAPQESETPSQDPDEVINLTNSPAKTISDSPDTIVDSDDAMSGIAGAGGGEGADVGGLLASAEEEGNLKDFEDLYCCVCGEMMFTATNRLIECSKCGALYHQECHKPAITDEEASEGQKHSWQCDTCFSKPSTSRAAGIVLLPEEPLRVVPKPAKSSATSSRSSSSSNSSSKSHRDRSSSSASKATAAAPAAAPASSVVTPPSPVVTPAFNVISAPDKGSKSSSHSSSSKSSSKSSRHHESSSKRRSRH